MHTRPALFLVLGALSVSVPLACGDDTSNNTGGSNAGGSNNGGESVGPTTSTLVGPTTGTQMMTQCTDEGAPWGACGACAERSCCDELLEVTKNGGGVWNEALANCAAENCEDCGGQPYPAELSCDAPPEPQAKGACVSIGGPLDCNPVTNEGCDGNGAACDINGFGFNFACYPDGNVRALCEACGAPNFCQAGLTCVNGTCAKYCCLDADCGSGTCTTGVFGADPDLGVCAGDGPVGGGGGGGVGGAGGIGGTGGIGGAGGI